MRRSPAAFLVFFLAGGCATAPGEPAAPLERREIRIEIPGAAYSVGFTRTVDAWVATLPLPAQQVWAAVPAVYDSLGLDGGGLLEPGRQAYGFRGRMPTRIAGRSPSAYLDCGRGLAGPNADQYEVRVSVVTQVEPAGEEARVSTLVDASATPRDVRGDAVGCSTTGQLERLILQELGTAAGR